MTKVPECSTNHLRGFEFGGSNISTSPNGNTLALGGGDTKFGPRRRNVSELTVWDLPSFKIRWHMLDVDREPIDRIRWDPDGSRIGIHRSSSSSIDVLCVETGAVLFHATIGENVVIDFQFIDQAALIVVSMLRGKCFLHLVQHRHGTVTERVIPVTMPATGCVPAAVLHDKLVDATYLFANDDDGKVWFTLIAADCSDFDWHTKLPRMLLNAAVARKGVVVVAGEHRTAGVVAVLGDKFLDTVRMMRLKGVKSTNCVAISPSGAQIAFADDSNTILVVEIDSFKETHRIRVPCEKTAGIVGVTFGSRDSTIVWTQACGFGPIPAAAGIVRFTS